jgi:hypothetical protein
MCFIMAFACQAWFMRHCAPAVCFVDATLCRENARASTRFIAPRQFRVLHCPSRTRGETGALRDVLSGTRFLLHWCQDAATDANRGSEWFALRAEFWGVGDRPSRGFWLLPCHMRFACFCSNRRTETHYPPLLHALPSSSHALPCHPCACLPPEAFRGLSVRAEWAREPKTSCTFCKRV